MIKLTQHRRLMRDDNIKQNALARVDPVLGTHHAPVMKQSTTTKNNNSHPRPRQTNHIPATLKTPLKAGPCRNHNNDNHYHPTTSSHRSTAIFLHTSFPRARAPAAAAANKLSGRGPGWGAQGLGRSTPAPRVYTTARRNKITQAPLSRGRQSLAHTTARTSPLDGGESG